MFLIHRETQPGFELLFYETLKIHTWNHVYSSESLTQIDFDRSENNFSLYLCKEKKFCGKEIEAGFLCQTPESRSAWSLSNSRFYADQLQSQSIVLASKKLHWTSTMCLVRWSLRWCFCSVLRYFVFASILLGFSFPLQFNQASCLLFTIRPINRIQHKKPEFNFPKE